ncbi:uncharacterized protein LOC135215606 [Macrobrachium nipponense]|uniref:uncharacterized protein LOC135215606 n=1 Tax=Macrobrachium nipponense TaxID=159736 RepID=UPI0030C7B762
MDGMMNNYRPVLKFLFQHQERICKELEKCIHQDFITRRIEHTLSNEACAALRDKLLSHPLETADFLHQLLASERRTNSNDSSNSSNTKVSDKASSGEIRAVGIDVTSRAKESYCRIENCFIECLDHLLRRIEDLDEKVLQLERELEALVERYGNNSSPRRAKFGNASESIEVTRIKERIQVSSAEKLRTVNLFYLMLAISSDIKTDVLQELYLRIVAICHDKSIINIEQVYFSHFSGSDEKLQSFCEVEADYLVRKPYKTSSNIECLSTSLDVRGLYFECTSNSRHVLQVVFEMLAHDPVQSITLLQREEDWSRWLVPFYPVIFLNSWSTSLDKLESLLGVAKVWEGQPNAVDLLMLNTCNELKRDLNFVNWCMARNTNVKMLPLLLLIRDHSPLYTLYRSLPLYDLKPNEVKQLLHEHCQVRDPSGQLLSSCISTYQAFCILNEMFQIIAAGMQLDNSVAGWQARGKLLGDRISLEAKNFDLPNNDTNDYRNKQSLVSFYQKNIVEKLLSVKEKIDELQPLEYRMQIMENIFSLLFVRHSDMSDESHSDSGGDEADLERSFLSHPNGSESPVSTLATSNPNTESGKISEKEEPSKVKKVLLLDFVEEALASDQTSQIETPVQENCSYSDADSCNNAGSSMSVSPDTPAHSWKASWHTAAPGQMQSENHHCSSQSGTAPQHQSSCTVSGKSTASSVGELPRTGYIINSLVAWDILILLHESLLTTSAERYSQKANQSSLCEDGISGQVMHSRISHLSRHVSEGLWRLQVLVPCHRKIGSLENFGIYVEGKLFFKDINETEYETNTHKSLGKVNTCVSVKKRHETTEGRSSMADDTSVINYLLAPPPCLVTLALTNGNLTQAEQVIKMYKIGDTTECREVCLAARLHQLKPRLVSASQRAHKGKGSKIAQAKGSTEHGLLTLGLVAREASAQAAAASLVHELLSTLSPPIPTGISVIASETNCPVTASFLNPQSMVLSDLALTVDLNESSSSSLLEQALQRHRAHVEGTLTLSELSKTGSDAVGFISFTQQMAATCNNIITLRNLEVKVSSSCDAQEVPFDVCVRIGPAYATPMSLLLSSYPINDVAVKNYIQSWSRVLHSMSTFQGVLLSPEEEDDDFDESSIHCKGNKVHLAYKEVLRIMSEEATYLYPDNLKIKESSKFGAYVRSFYQYLQLMSLMITNYANSSFKRGLTSYFSLLSIRPVHILGSLMFQDGVDPGKLEHTARKMKLNLTTMILQYCCPMIGIMRPKSWIENEKLNSDESIRLGFLFNDDSIIMNAGSMTCRSGVYGEVVVRDVLTTLLSGLRESIPAAPVSENVSHQAVLLNDVTAATALKSLEVVTVLRDTSDLASVDFKKIAVGDEGVVFFINLANLMFIHAGLLNHIFYPGDSKCKSPRGIFSDYQLERIMAMKRVGYTVGQLGFVSLFDVLYGILQLPNPLSSILIQNNPSNRFTLCKSDLLNNNFSITEKEDYHHILSLLKFLSSKVNFCVTQGTPMSPSVEVLYSDRMAEQQERAISEHLNLFLIVEDNVLVSDTQKSNEKNGGYCIATSRTILNYLASHPDGVAGGIKSLENDVPEDIASILRSFTRNFDQSEIEFRVLDRDEKRGIALEFIETFEPDKLNISSSKSESSSFSDVSEYLPEELPKLSVQDDHELEVLEPLDWSSARVPVAVLSHLRKQCPLLAFIVQAIHSTLEASKKGSVSSDDDISDTWLNILYPPSIGMKPPPEETALFRAARNLFSSRKHKALSEIVQANRVLSSLMHEPEVSCVWQFADEFLGSNTITKDNFHLLVSRAPKVIYVLHTLSASMLNTHPDILLLRDHLLAFMVQTVPLSESNPTPWEYAHEISNSQIRFSVIQKSHSEWPVSPAVKLLNVLGCDTQLTGLRREWAKKRAIQIKVYAEILNIGNPAVETWQEVEHLSSNDPSTLLLMLIQKKQFKLGVQWAEHHNVDSKLRQLVDQSYLMSILDMTSPDYGVASSALESLSFKDLTIVTEALLVKLSSIPTRRFLLEFLLKTSYPKDPSSILCESYGTYMGSLELEQPPTKENSKTCESQTISEHLDMDPLRQELMGLILVEEVAPVTDDRYQLSHLASHPHFIIEQWLMNIKLEAVEKAVKVLGKHMDMIGSRFSKNVDDENLGISWSYEDANSKKTEPGSLSWNTFNWLIEAYAAKSLDTTGVQFTLKPKQRVDKMPKKFVMPPQPPDRKDWVPDNEVSECLVCNVAVFSMFCRRHHCRRCGRVVCGSCSKSRMVVQGYGDLLVRVCQECFQQTKDINLMEYDQIRPLGEGNYDSQSEISDVLSTRGSSSWSSDAEGGWYLTTDMLHNNLVRQEFGYDYAPSLSLCLAILAHHQDDRKAAICIIKLCHHLFSLIVSAVICTSPEVDHNFVLSMIQTLLTSSKVRFGNVNEHQGIAVCEYYSQWVDLLSLLLRASCGDVIPQRALQNMLEIGTLHQKLLQKEENCKRKFEKCLQQEFVYMRHIRDSLVKKQLWELSLNVSTKAGLEVTGVWGAWAMASLKAGDFPGARERFARVLERPLDKNRPCKSSLLPEIIKFLESSPFIVNEKVLDHAERTRILLSEQTRFPPSQALVVLHTLQNLQSISVGSLRTKSGVVQSMPSAKSKKNKSTYKMDTLFQNECKYYLRLYGDHSMTIQFFMRHRQLQECAEYLLANEVREDIFISEVLLPCLRLGKLEQLLKIFRTEDPQQTKWYKYMLRGCRSLEHNKWWNCLLMVQEALGDRLRAVMTLLKMYNHEIGNYYQLSNRVHILTSAQHHLQTYLNTQILHGSFAKSKIILNMSGWQVNQYINMLALQADATKFLAGYEANSDIIGKLLQNLVRMKLIEERSLPTLLGDENERLAVGALIVSGAQVVEESLGLAYRIVESMGVPAEKLLSVGCELLVEMAMCENIGSLVKGMGDFGILTPSQVDSALEPALLKMSTSANNVNLDVIVKLFSSENAKIEAYIKCGRLKSAYLVAVHRGKYEDVILVQQAAKQSGQAHVATMCTKWLANHKSFVGAR